MAQKVVRPTSRHLLSHNLGSIKKDRKRRKAEARLRQIHNQAISEAFYAHPAVSDLAVEDLGFVSSTDRGPTANRRLARWAKGQLQADLERISEANGVSLRVVNAAYSSQACPVCSWTERANRTGQTFRCRRCGYAGRADPVAASNLRSRISDAEIGRFTPYKVVKQILDRRAAVRAEALGLPAMESEDHGAAPGMTTTRHGVESPTPENV
jgi:transposase